MCCVTNQETGRAWGQGEHGDREGMGTGHPAATHGASPNGTWLNPVHPHCIQDSRCPSPCPKAHRPRGARRWHGVTRAAEGRVLPLCGPRPSGGTYSNPAAIVKRSKLVRPTLNPSAFLAFLRTGVSNLVGGGERGWHQHETSAQPPRMLCPTSGCSGHSQPLPCRGTRSLHSTAQRLMTDQRPQPCTELLREVWG